MGSTELVYRTRMPAPASDVLAWHARPGAFERLTPPWMKVRIEAAGGSIKPGDWKRLRVGSGLLSFSWTLRHQEAASTCAFVDVQERGPFRAWRHEHRFEPADEQTSWLEDRISYQLPLDPLSSLVIGPLVRRELERLFRFRHRRTAHDVTRHRTLHSETPLRIAVTGASGLVGRQLVPFLRAGGHEVITLVRRTPAHGSEVFWDPATGQIEAERLERLDAVVHLAGASIAGGRWTARRKQAIEESRVRGTSLLAETLAGLKHPPRVLVSGSAVGYYGNAGSRILTESSPPGSGFLARVCQAWEAATRPAATAGIRVVLLRTGIVIAGNGGLLPRIVLPFRFGLGGPLGPGDQMMSWIALDDLLSVILTAIMHDTLTGPINAVSPIPVSNREFSTTLGRVLHRPAIARVPAPLLRLVAGQLADELILASQRALPVRLQEDGFAFAFPRLEDALRFELGRFQDTSSSEVASVPVPPAMQSTP